VESGVGLGDPHSILEALEDFSFTDSLEDSMYKNVSFLLLIFS